MRRFMQPRFIDDISPLPSHLPLLLLLHLLFLSFSRDAREFDTARAALDGASPTKLDRPGWIDRYRRVATRKVRNVEVRVINGHVVMTRTRRRSVGRLKFRIGGRAGAKRDYVARATLGSFCQRRLRMNRRDLYIDAPRYRISPKYRSIIAA